MRMLNEIRRERTKTKNGFKRTLTFPLMKQKYMPPILHMEVSLLDIFGKTTHKTLWQQKRQEETY